MYIYLAWGYILQSRTNVALVSQAALNEYAHHVAEKSLQNNSMISRKDWKWKVIPVDPGDGDLGITQPIVVLKHSYWAKQFNYLYQRIMVGVRISMTILELNLYVL